MDKQRPEADTERIRYTRPMVEDIWGCGCKHGNWWLRSPNSSNANNAWFGNNDGSNRNNNDVANENHVARPDLPHQPETRRQAPAVRAGAKESCSRPSANLFDLIGADKHLPPERADASRFGPLSGGSGPRPAVRWEDVPITDFEKVCDFDSLYRAHQKARLGKRNKPDIISFEMDLANSLWAIKERLEDGSYTVGNYKRFTIHDPKTREIQALCYADRIVQHCLCDNVLTPFFENRLIYDNCACRVGKGTHFGMERLASFMREHYKLHGAKGWLLKADVRKFFQNIDHAVLIAMLRKSIPDPDVLRLCENVIHSFNADTGRGLPMGNQTSQLFALYYLDPLDRLVKEKLRIKHYTRYMDDMVLLHPNKAVLQKCLCQMRALAGDELHMTLNEKTHIFPVVNGVDYLGWHFYLTNTGKVVKKLRATNKKKLKRRMKGLQKGYTEGKLEIGDVNRSIAATNGHLCHGHTYKLRKKIYAQTVFVRNGGE